MLVLFTKLDSSWQLFFFTFYLSQLLLCRERISDEILTDRHLKKAKFEGKKDHSKTDKNKKTDLLEPLFSHSQQFLSFIIHP